MAKFLTFFSLVFLVLADSAQARDLGALYEKAKFKIGNQNIEAYIADNEERRRDGLMHIEKLPDNMGMLFIFETERTLAFWMKNTLIPLSIGYFSADGRLVDLQEMQVASSSLVKDEDLQTYPSREPAQFALEMKSGWFSRHKIKVGAQLQLDSKINSALGKTLLRGKNVPSRQ